MVLKNEIISRIKPVIESWPSSGIYAVSLFVNNYCDNPCEPTVTLGFNTEQQYHLALTQSSSNEEARWNYAYWIQNKTLVFGDGETKDIVKQ